MPTFASTSSWRSVLLRAVTASLLGVLLWGVLAVCAGAAHAYPTKLETLTLANTNTAGVTSTAVLVPGHAYRLVASGEVSDWTADPSGVYSGEAWGVDPLYCYAVWRCPTPELWRQLQVYNPGTTTPKGLDEWSNQAGAIPYNPAHVYQADATGISGKLRFGASDAPGSSGDNSGAWNIELWDLGGHDPTVGYSFRSYTNDVRLRQRWQLGVSRWAGRGNLTAASPAGTTSSLNIPTFYPRHSMRTRVESYKLAKSGVRKVLTLNVIVTASSNAKNCVVGTRGTITLVDDKRRMKNRQTRDSFTQIYPQSTCPSFVQGTTNKNHAHTEPTRGGLPRGGQWVVVNIKG